jgi:uroporphyrin-III C-methyltransferase/precorrin-2 dehydrogenase/sirohydrochlorin ferrochelatase
MTGHVSLIGAGPGDPALLTRRAAARLRAADLVLFDALVDKRVMRLARRARCVSVGKRAGHPSMSQGAINELMIRGARHGLRVARLKGGDPFVLGRGGEEALALKAAGIPFEIVPGVTSAIAAPAAAGIPVTHRGLAAGFVVVSGHDAQAFARATAGLAPGALTLVVLMAIERRQAIAETLLTRGWPPGTPAAIVSSAWSARERIWRGPLGALAEAPIDRAAPGTLIVGEVATLDAGSSCQPPSAGRILRPHDHALRRIPEAPHE